jgi:hypothetical protein
VVIKNLFGIALGSLKVLLVPTKLCQKEAGLFGKKTPKILL